MKVAIVHDWLTVYAGAERNLEQMLKVFPNADLFCLVDFVDDRDFLQGKQSKTSFIQKLPFSKKYFRNYLPLMPMAIERFDLSDYDLVISNHFAVAGGIITGPDQLHISYIQSPMRYAWDLQHRYLKETGLERGLRSILVKYLLHRLRIWDVTASKRPDILLANSKFIARRIMKCYRREAQVLYPPVDVEAFTLSEKKQDYYLAASRMVPYKMMPMIIEAFKQMPEKRLVVIGDGPEMPRAKKLAGDNIEILGYQPFSVLLEHMQNARAFIFAAEEDFGIVPLEAQACGTPVIAYGKGGALETVKDNSQAEPTGAFFPEQTSSCLIETIRNVEPQLAQIQPVHCRKNALSYSADRFRTEFEAIIATALGSFKK